MRLQFKTHAAKRSSHSVGGLGWHADAAGRIVSAGTIDDILDEYQSILHGAFPRMAMNLELAAKSISAGGSSTERKLLMKASRVLKFARGA